MKALTTFLLVLLLWPVISLGAPSTKNTLMPISKVWHRKFVAGPFVPLTRVPRVPMVAKPVGRPGMKIDVNSCSLEDLQNLPGVGAALGAHIMAGRPYRSFDDLSRDGIPMSTVDQLRSLVSFGP
jgi:DNA uptake protein ComE-like DNA-binding protein